MGFQRSEIGEIQSFTYCVLRVPILFGGESSRPGRRPSIARFGGRNGHPTVIWAP